MNKNKRTRKGLRLFPVIFGVYGLFFGFGLIAIGFSQIKEIIGIIRLLMGLGMAGFGLLAIWDGVRDLIKPVKKPENHVPRQFILTDISGIKSSHVTPELLKNQMDALTESEEYKSFDLQILPPIPVEERGMLKQILCFYHEGFNLIGFFEIPDEGHRMFRKITDSDTAVEWLKNLSEESPDFSGWEDIKAADSGKEEDIFQEEEDTLYNEENIDMEELDTPQDAKAFFLNQLKEGQSAQMNHWHQRLMIFGESWHNELKFFSAKDVELAVDGIYEGKYQRVVLEWGIQAVNLIHREENNIMIIWCTYDKANGNAKFLARTGTVTQVKFLLINYLDQGFFETEGWSDITEQITIERRKGGKKHGKVF